MKLQGRKYEISKSIFTTLIDSIDKNMIVEEPDLCYKFLFDRVEEIILLDNIIDLYLFRETNVSKICASVILQSLTNS